jgi:hypothetical protein
MPQHKPHNTTLVAIANDFHVPFHDERALRLFHGFLKREQPGWLVLAGDFTDFWEISAFDKTPRTGKALMDEIRIGRKILAGFRRVLPRTRITWIEGNHEFRLRKYLIKNAPELYGLTGLSVPELFGLKELGIEYAPCPPAASKFVDNFIRVGKLHVGHWDKVARHGGAAARSLVEDKGVNILQGHTHRFGAHARTTVDGHVLLGVENFCMCARNASYASRPNWQLGFSVLYLDVRNGAFQWYPVTLDRHGFVWNGRRYALGRKRKRTRTS